MGYVVDVLSIVLAAIGWGKDRGSKISDRRIEAYRLNAEVAAEALVCINLLDLASPGILRRAGLLLPDQPQVRQNISDTLSAMRTQSEQLYAMAEGYKPMIEGASTWTDWDKAVRQQHEWRATASALRPYIEGIIKRYEDTLNAGEQIEPPPHAALLSGHPKDRGWDAPPL
jgi:hypothetical protein